MSSPFPAFFMKSFPLFLVVGAAAISLAPAARAMVASVGGAATHNTTCESGLQEIWNRTAQLAGGTGTYIGKSADGTHWLLTANHVASGGGTIATTDAGKISFSYAETSHTLKNADGTSADLKLVAINATGTAAAYLDALGNIGIYDQALDFSTGMRNWLYTVGTGYSVDIGESYTSGTRAKQWARFVAIKEASFTNDRTAYYYTVFSKQLNSSYQAATYDSGSGVFIYGDGSGWQVLGVALAVGGTAENVTTVNYYDESNPSICYTFFANLSEYAEQIDAVLAIPEPSAFGLLAGTFALALAVSRRRRTKKA